MMLNSAFAESLKIYADRLEGAEDFETALHDMIKKTIKDVGLEGVENINYLQAIKRVIGMSDKPLANE